MRTLLLPLLCLATSAWAAPSAFTGEDLSGSYNCTGHDNHDGDYKASLVLHLDKARSEGQYAAYTLVLTIPGEVAHYNGAMVVEGNRLAMMFSSSDPLSKDSGTGLGTITHDAKGQPGFSKFYFEPDYKGGNTGTESCNRAH